MKERYNIYITPLVLLIASLVVCGINATYKAKDYAIRLIESALEKQSLEAKYQSADRVLNKLHTIKYEQIQDLIAKVSEAPHPKGLPAGKSRCGESGAS